MSAAEDSVRVGHWTSADGRTGCTVIVLPEQSVTSGEVRGGAPATRDFELLDPTRTVQHVDAVVLTGGSAYGLATADGVMAWLAEQGRGYGTRKGPVPIVVAMGLFDLEEDVERPGAVQGRLAAEVASPGRVVGGRVGAGAGATLAKWRGIDQALPGGLGVTTLSAGDVTVTAVIAVNAVGEIDDGSVAAAVATGKFEYPSEPETEGENTTIGVIWTNAELDKVGCRLVAESGHDGLGRALLPAHTQGDGDALVVASVGSVEARLAEVRLLATLAVEQAIRSVGRD